MTSTLSIEFCVNKHSCFIFNFFNDYIENLLIILFVIYLNFDPLIWVFWFFLLLSIQGLFTYSEQEQIHVWCLHSLIMQISCPYLNTVNICGEDCILMILIDIFGFKFPSWTMLLVLQSKVIFQISCHTDFLLNVFIFILFIVYSLR